MKTINNDLKKNLDKFKNLKIGVVGDFMLDEYIIGHVTRISPEAPVPIVNVIKEKFTTGGAANVVNNIAALGGTTLCFGVLGTDANGDRLTDTLSLPNINTDGLIKTTIRPTTVKTRIIGENQQLLRIDWENTMPIDIDLEDDILKNIKKNIKDLDAVIMSDYDKGVLTKRISQEVIDLCNKNKKIVIVDPKPKNALNYVGATSMTPNRKELRECLDADELSDLIKCGKEIKKKLKLKNLLLTRSEEGMTLFLDKPINIPTFAKEVYDVTGAGDTVISVYTMGCALGLGPEESAKIANTAAGVVVGKIGTSTVSKNEILDFYNKIYKNN